MQTPDYTLEDFGEGRRLERFGPLRLDRPCPAAAFVKRRHPKAWNAADAVFVENAPSSERGVWKARTEIGRKYFSDKEPLPWTVDFGTISLELKGTPFGHIGVFPEQISNWQTIARLVGNAAAKRSTPIRVLNLFSYTGGSSLAAAITAPNVEVVHVDAAKNLLRWAKRNAELNGLVNAKIRWIAEDAPKFVRRERKRGNGYHAVILDPPTYGHGTGGEVWKFSEHLPDLMNDLFAVMESEPLFLLLTAHTPNVDAAKLADIVRGVFPKNGPLSDFRFRHSTMFLTAGTRGAAQTQAEGLPSGNAVLLCSSEINVDHFRGTDSDCR